MFRPISLYIGLRYTRAQRRSHFVSFISMVSMLGIALGVTVLITVLSVMNGFDFEIQNKIFEMAQQVSISNYNDPLANWQDLAKKVEQYPNVVSAAPFVNGQGMLVSSGLAAPVLVRGISPAEENKVSKLSSRMASGSFNQLVPGQYGVVMGQALADTLGLQMGDKVTLFTPQATITPMGELPRFRRFTVVGLFNIEHGFGGFNTGIIFINLHDAQVLYGFGNNVSGLRLKVSSLYAAPKVTDELQRGFQGKYLVSNWTEQYGDFFRAIKMEKTMMFFILILIVAVAAFNLVSSLVMIVNDKRSEIAILRTLGASPGTIMAIFMVQGCTVGFIGSLLGLIGGIALALNATELVSYIQHLFHVNLISSSVYLVDYLPSKLEFHDVWRVTLLALGLSLIATLYPAWQAARTQPAEALRYE